MSKYVLVPSSVYIYDLIKISYTNLAKASAHCTGQKLTFWAASRGGDGRPRATGVCD